jgi:AmpD protein
MKGFEWFMIVNPVTGLLDVARQVSSPNFDDRPENTPVDLLVIHNISLPPGQFGGPWIDHLFTNRLNPDEHAYFKEIHTMAVSAHILIRRDGDIIQYVPFHKRAWHAGQSNYGGRERCNDFSIGIELEGSDDQPFEERQYRQLAALIKALLQAYPSLSVQHITGHSDIAPGRKTDPGPHFDWQKLHRLLA